jgi:hypothetical protein
VIDTVVRVWKGVDCRVGSEDWDSDRDRGRKTELITACVFVH